MTSATNRGNNLLFQANENAESPSGAEESRVIAA
jgi:hypothetical protein